MLVVVQVTDMGLCQSLVDMHNAGINLTILVSYRVESPSDCPDANTCYNFLYENGVTVYLSPTYYDVSHNKFWIMDGKRVSWSTGNWSPSDYPTVCPFHLFLLYFSLSVVLR